MAWDSHFNLLPSLLWSCSLFFFSAGYDGTSEASTIRLPDTPHQRVSWSFSVYHLLFKPKILFIRFLFRLISPLLTHPLYPCILPFPSFPVFLFMFGVSKVFSFLPFSFFYFQYHASPFFIVFIIWKGKSVHFTCYFLFHIPFFHTHAISFFFLFGEQIQSYFFSALLSLISTTVLYSLPCVSERITSLLLFPFFLSFFFITYMPSPFPFLLSFPPPLSIPSFPFPSHLLCSFSLSHHFHPYYSCL